MRDSGITDLKDLDPKALSAFLGSLGEPAYRGRQVMRWLYQRDRPDPADWTDLPLELRERLAKGTSVTRLEEVARRRSAKDGTTKLLWRLADGQTVESVGIFEGRRLTVCFSTQVGCALGCTFCATGLGGYVRNLSAGEIVDQVLRAGVLLGEAGRTSGGRGPARDQGAGRVPARENGRGRVTNAVAMGQGEPFLNYGAVVTALRIMNAREGLGIGARHLTVSTRGAIGGIERFSKEPEQFGLAISLHAARQEVRDAIMPGAKRWRLDDLRSACRDYSERTGRRVTFEYALLGGANDSEEDLTALTAFCRGLLCHVNLIPANPVAGSGHSRPTRARVAHFKGELMAAGIEASTRVERGADIEAACGQLRQVVEGKDVSTSRSTARSSR